MVFTYIFQMWKTWFAVVYLYVPRTDPVSKPSWIINGWKTYPQLMLLKELYKPPPQNLPALCLGRGVYEVTPILDAYFLIFFFFFKKKK